MLRFDLARGSHHGGKGIGNIVNGFRKELLCQHGPGRTAGREQKGKVPCRHRMDIMLRFRSGSDIRSDGGLIYIRKAQLL